MDPERSFWIIPQMSDDFVARSAQKSSNEPRYVGVIDSQLSSCTICSSADKADSFLRFEELPVLLGCDSVRRLNMPAMGLLLQ